MLEEEIDKKVESYGADLCAMCRECDKGNCQHKTDAIHGYLDGLKATIADKEDTINYLTFEYNQAREEARQLHCCGNCTHDHERDGNGYCPHGRVYPGRKGCEAWEVEK